MDTLLKIGQFLLDHADLVSLIFDAFDGGVTKDAIIAAVKVEMVKASDAEMKKEMGL